MAGKLLMEQKKTQEVVEKMEQMKLELKMIETSDTSVASIWKRKCLDLFEVCTTLKSENDDLREKCQDLIIQGIKLSEIINSETLGPSMVSSNGFQHQKNTSLPKINVYPMASTTYGFNFNRPAGTFSSGARGLASANTQASHHAKGLGITTPVVESIQEYGSAHIDSVRPEEGTGRDNAIYENTGEHSSVNSYTQ